MYSLQSQKVTTSYLLLEPVYKTHDRLACGTRLTHLTRTGLSLGILPWHTGTSPSPQIKTFYMRSPCTSSPPTCGRGTPVFPTTWTQKVPHAGGSGGHVVTGTLILTQVTVLFHTIPVKAQQHQRYTTKCNCTCHSRTAVLTVPWNSPHAFITLRKKELDETAV